MSASSSSPSPTDYPFLRTRIDQVKGVGQQKLQLLHRLEIYNIATLIKHLPLRWERHAGQLLIRDLVPEQKASIIAEIAYCRWVPGGRQGYHSNKGRFEATLEDASGEIKAIWFNSAYLRDKLHPGMKLKLEAKVSRYQQEVQMVNPAWRILDDQVPQDMNDSEKLIPIYPSTEGLNTSFIHQLIQSVLTQAMTEIDDHLNPQFREDKSLPSLSEAYRMIHQPSDEQEIKSARRRLAYDEVFLLQMAVLLKRYHHQQHHQSPQLELNKQELSQLMSIPPFTLTTAQSRVTEEILKDMTRPFPMNRLIQGDVGSGKTMVATLAMVAAINKGYQAALMAPTELLAEQHYRSIQKNLQGSGIKVTLLMGSLSNTEKKTLHQQLKSGEIQLVIGTHALLSESVEFQQLALIVIDEQHRFGVEQRASMKQRQSDQQLPHCLVMTATPIPRTLSLTVFGDLDVSTIDELPPGRSPITTRFIHEDDASAYYEELCLHLNQGARAYMVLPAIDEGSLGLRSVSSHMKYLRKGPLQGISIASVHGRLDAEERDQIMADFKSGEIQLLIATTVIEVGVDVPEATIMIVEHAERFGLAQLHQLRGRVGRGHLASECILIANPSTEQALQRINTLVKTQDGFEIAEVDLSLRGMGETSGTRQSGADQFKIVRLPDDLALLQMARRDAASLIESDPLLSDGPHAILKRRLLKEHGRQLNFIDVA